MITQMLGGDVKPASHGGEYGRMPMDITPGSTLFSFLDKSTVNVWMSHGDEAVKLPEGFTSVAKSHQVRSTKQFMISLFPSKTSIPNRPGSNCRD